MRDHPNINTTNRRLLPGHDDGNAGAVKLRPASAAHHLQHLLGPKGKPSYLACPSNPATPPSHAYIAARVLDKLALVQLRSFDHHHVGWKVDLEGERSSMDVSGYSTLGSVPTSAAISIAHPDGKRRCRDQNAKVALQKGVLDHALVRVRQAGVVHANPVWQGLAQAGLKRLLAVALQALSQRSICCGGPLGDEC